MCDAAYLCQWEVLERQSLSQMALLPHLTEDGRQSFPWPEKVRAEFDAWLAEPPVDDRQLTPAEMELADLHDLMGVGRR